MANQPDTKDQLIEILRTTEYSPGNKSFKPAEEVDKNSVDRLLALITKERREVVDIAVKNWRAIDIGLIEDLDTQIKVLDREKINFRRRIIRALRGSDE